ncbi:MAG TPA: hypothetical protein VH107_06530 [Lacipirellulaceae bacterium]|nr:hypothetical protein [Lacipirellulaceae bacterium]
MNFQPVKNRRVREYLCLLLAPATALAPSAPAIAQGFGAIQAVRQRVEGLNGGPDTSGPGSSTPGGAVPGANGAKLDTSYISSNASVLLAIRPAQLMASPFAQMFPVEVASAAGVKYAGIDPADVEEAVAFLDMTNPIAPTYGVTVKFTKPFRATALPPQIHPFVKLSELNGKKYLESSNPMWPSFYGADNKTLIAAPDAMLKQIVTSGSQPKSGKLIDQSREVPAGNDLYLALDVAALRPMMQMGLAQMQAKAPPAAKPLFDALNLAGSAELTLNVVTPGPTTLVVQGNDEAAAQQIETTLQDVAQKMRASGTPGQPGPAPDDTIQQAMGRYQERMAQHFQPQRNGTSVTCLKFDGQDPAQRQQVTMTVTGLTVAAMLPAIQAARNAARRAEAAKAGAPPATRPDAGPGGPAAAPPQ